MLISLRNSNENFFTHQISKEGQENSSRTRNITTNGGTSGDGDSATQEVGGAAFR